MPLYGLTDEQRAVATQPGSLLLTACPGSGKTRTLASKIAHRLTQDTESLTKRWLIAITYTNVAAETILNRLDNYGIDKRNLWVGTIHSFCLEWVLKPYKHLHPRISKGYRIIDEYEQNKLLRSIKKEFGFQAFDSLQTHLTADLNIDLPPGAEYDAVSRYHQILGEEKQIDFDHILSLSLFFLKTTPLIAERLSRLFDTIYVDEYQDTHQVQYDILSSIIGHSRTNLVLIGDVDQAIYTGLGAVVKNEEEIKEEFSIDELATLDLSGCYRSTQEIIDFYRHFQDHEIEIESLTTAPQTPTSVILNTEANRDELAQHISPIIRHHLDEGIIAEEIAILAPQWTDVIHLGRALSTTCPDIPFDAPGTSPLPRSVESPFHSLIRLFFNTPGPENYSKRRHLAKYVREHLENTGFSFDFHKDPIRSILKACNTISFLPDSRITAFLDHFIRSFLDILKLDIDSNSNALESLTSLLDSVEENINRLDLPDEAKYLKTCFNDKSGVVVTSCHQTKGEEYEVVIATGLLKGRVPHWNDIIECSQEHQDYMARRLLYVISSRAKRYLYLYSEQGHRTSSGNPLSPSQQLIAAFR